MTIDQEVIQAVLQGDPERYGELVSKYQLAAWRLAYSLVGDMEEAKDLSQNGFIKAYQNLACFRGGSKFSTWLHRIVANECKEYFRRKGRRPEHLSLSPADGEGESPLPFDVPDPAANPREAAADREMGRRLARAIGALPMKQRTAFLLHQVNGLPMEEAAQIMGCRLGTVKSHLFRAAQNLRTAIEPYVNVEMEVAR